VDHALLMASGGHPALDGTGTKVGTVILRSAARRSIFSGDGAELQAKLKAEGSRIPIVFITARGDGQMKMHAMQAGAVAFLSKPFDDEVLLEKVRAALKG